MSKCIEKSNCSDRNDRYNQHPLSTPRGPRKQRMGTGRSCGRFMRPFELIPCRHRAYVTAERVPSGNSLRVWACLAHLSIFYMNCLLLTRCNLDEILNVGKIV